MSHHDLSSRLKVVPGKNAKLSKIDPAATPGFKNREEAEKTVEINRGRLADLQYRLYAEQSRSLLVVLQGTDTSGKDGTIRHVFSGVNPQGCSVYSFKKPSEEEMRHDFLWRVHPHVPAKGIIGIFNRSHYEDVVAARVLGIVPEKIWKKRYDKINAFEELISDHGTIILKFFLHISKEEQKERLEKRLADPSKHWKMNLGDLEQRKWWQPTLEAYEDAITRCSTAAAPWHVIPADKKWYRNVAISEIVCEALEHMNPKFPRPKADFSHVRVR